MAVDQNKLESEGWTRQSVASEPRLGESVQMYEELGLEVLLVPLVQLDAAKAEEGSCTACFDADTDPERNMVIFTRPSGAAGVDEEELF